MNRIRMEAKYKGICVACLKPTRPGSPIWWDLTNKETWHIYCKDKPRHKKADNHKNKNKGPAHRPELGRVRFIS